MSRQNEICFLAHEVMDWEYCSRSWNPFEDPVVAWEVLDKAVEVDGYTIYADIPDDCDGNDPCVCQPICDAIMKDLYYDEGKDYTVWITWED